MLTYLGRGERRYGTKPLPASRRKYWEFQAVVAGRINLVHREETKSSRRRTLWIFPPGYPHGWSGERNEAAEVVVFHFLTVPEALRRAVPESGFFEIRLTADDCRRLRKLAEGVARYWTQPALGMTLSYEHALLELCLLSLAALPQPPLAPDNRRNRVNHALKWYSDNIERNPSLPQMAHATGMSTAHMRRLFHEVLQISPKQIMDQLRFQRATQLMSDPSVKLEAVGEACGFSSASSFSRAFKNKFGCSPDSWRG